MRITLDKKIKIINILSRLNIGGPSLHAVLITRHLNNDDFVSLMISGQLSKGEGDMSYLLDESPISHMSVDTMSREISFKNDLEAIIDLYKIFRREKPAIVHTNMAKAGMVGRAAAFLAGVPIIIHTFHGHVFSGYFSSLKTNIFIIIERFLALISTNLIAISSQVKREICSVYRITSDKKVSIIPLGFELDKLEPRDNYQGYYRSQFSLPDDSPIIGIVGRITGIKNHKLFIDIAKLLHSENQRIHFLIVGDGELRSEMENYVSSIGMSNCIHFAGWIKETAKIYADLDIMLLTSKNEGTPVTIIEAMHYKIPVVSSKVGGVPDIISHGRTGFLIDSFEPEDYLSSITKLLNDREIYNTIGNAANTSVNKEFTISRLLSDLTRLYHQLLEKKEIV